MRQLRTVATVATATLGLALTLSACGSSGAVAPADGEAADGASATGDQETSSPVSQETTRLCVLVSDATSSEAIGFRDYYTTYVQANFPVEFSYSEELADADAEKRAMENFIANNCKGVISFASADRPAQIEMAEAAGVHYAVATGTLTEEEYEQFRDYEYYVGAIGPSLDVERQAGYDLAKHYIDKGDTSFAIFGAGVPYYIDMHIYRVAGMLTALAEEPSTSYGGAKDFGAILGKIMQEGTIKPADFSSEVYTLTGYLEMWNFDDPAWQANMAAIVAAKPQAVLAAGTGFAVFGAAVADSGIEIGDIDAYTTENQAAMAAGTLTYLAGKFTSSTGPIFAATLTAALGDPIRTDDGSALALDQGYWVATTPEQFDDFLKADSIQDPAYGKEELDPFIGSGASYEDFAAFVSHYSYDDLVN